MQLSAFLTRKWKKTCECYDLRINKVNILSQIMCATIIYIGDNFTQFDVALHILLWIAFSAYLNGRLQLSSKTHNLECTSYLRIH